MNSGNLYIEEYELLKYSRYLAHRSILDWWDREVALTTGKPGTWNLELGTWESGVRDWELELGLGTWDGGVAPIVFDFFYSDGAPISLPKMRLGNYRTHHSHPSAHHLLPTPVPRARRRLYCTGYFVLPT